MENINEKTGPAIDGSPDKAVILNKLIEVFHDVVSDDVDLTRATTASDVAEWDSIAHVRLILSVERAFKVKFTASEISRLANIGDLVDLTAARMQS